MMNRKEILLNIILPIVVGFALYYAFFPEVIAVDWINSFLGFGFHTDLIERENIIVQFARWYLLDALWAYAFASSIYMFVDAGKRGALLAISFCTALELLQLSSYIRGDI